MKNITFKGKKYLDLPNGVYYDNINGNIFILDKKELKTFIDLDKKVGDKSAVSSLPVYRLYAESFESTSKLCLTGRPVRELTFLGDY